MATSGDVAQPKPAGQRLFAARLQLPVTSTSATKQQEKLIIEFDFHEFSTGLDVLQSVAEEIKADYTIATDEGETLNDLVVCVRDVDGADMLPIAAPLVAQAAVFQLCVAHLHQPHRKAPLFAVMTRSAAEARREHRLSRAAAGTAAVSAASAAPDEDAAAADAQPPTNPVPRDVEHGSAQSVAAQQHPTTSETSFSTIHFGLSQESSCSPGGAADGIAPLQSIDAYFPSVVEPQLRAMFGRESGMSWERVCEQLPLETEQLLAADGLVEGLVGQWKELRVEVIPGRRHWIHHLRYGVPTRDGWLKALSSETAETKRYSEVLSNNLCTARRQLAGAVVRRDASRMEVDRLEIAGVHASDALRRRDELQEKLRHIRLDAEEFRGLEETLRLRVREQKQKQQQLQRTDGSSDPLRSTSHPSVAVAKGDGRPTTPPRPLQDVSVDASDATAGDEFFDSATPPGNGLGFLSPSLRDKVSDALREHHTASPNPGPISYGDVAASPKDELRRLASQLTQYLNTASPNPQTRAHLLEQVRQAREAVERRRGLARSGSRGGDPHHATPHAAVYGLHVEPFAPRWPSTGWGDQTRIVDAASMSSVHRYDLPHAPLPSRGATTDMASLAERAVPFFQR